MKKIPLNNHEIKTKLMSKNELNEFYLSQCVNFLSDLYLKYGEEFESEIKQKGEFK